MQTTNDVQRPFFLCFSAFLLLLMCLNCVHGFIATSPSHIDPLVGTQHFLHKNPLVNKHGGAGMARSSLFLISPDQAVDLASQSDVLLQGADWFMNQLNSQYQDVLAQLAQKYSDSIHTLENIERVSVYKVDSKGFNVEVVYRETEQCIAVDVPISYPHGHCPDLKTAVSEFEELASNAALLTGDRLQTSVPQNLALSNLDAVMTPEVEVLCENLMGMINRDFTSDLLDIAKATQPSLFASSLSPERIWMENLNPVGFTIAFVFPHFNDDCQATPARVRVPFHKKCSSLPDFQECIKAVL